MANTTASRPDLLCGIIERLNETVVQVSQFRQSLGDLEIELIEIRRQCEDEIHSRRVAAAASTNNLKAHDGNKIATSPAPGGRPSPVLLQSPERDQDPIPPGREQKRIDRRAETPKSEPRRHRKSNSVRNVGKTKPEPKTQSPSPSSSPFYVPGGSGSPASCVVEAGNSFAPSRSPFRPMPTRALAAPEPVHKDTKKPQIPRQTLSRHPLQPPIHPSPFQKMLTTSFTLPNSNTNATVTFNPFPKVKQVLDVKLVHTLLHKFDVLCIKFSQDEEWLATGCYGTAQIYDVKTGVNTCTLNHYDNGYVNDVCFSPDGKYLATGGDDKQIRVWDIATQQIHDILEGHESAIWSLQFLPNGRDIVSGSDDGTVRVWDVHHRTSIVLTINDHYLSPDPRVRSVAISPDGRYIAVGSMYTAVTIWEVTTGVLVQTLRGHTNAVHSVTFTPDGKGLISGSWDAMLKHWDVSGLGIGSDASTSTSSSFSPCLLNLTGHKGRVYSTAISHDGTWVVSGSSDRNVLFWNTRTGVAQCMLSGHTDDVHDVDLSPMGHFLATASLDRQVRIWTYAASE